MEITAEQVWNEGLDLWSALEEYSDRDLWQEYETIHAIVTPKLPPADLPPESIAKVSEVLSRPLQFDPVEQFFQYQEIEAKVKSAFLNLLKNGELLGAGYAVPHRRNHLPARIPPDLWASGRISWAESELWAGADVFEQIRVVPSPKLRKATAVAAISTPEPRRRAGRPSRGGEILAAYVTLRDAGKIDYTSLNCNIDTIWNFLKLSGNPSSKETIRTASRDQFLLDRDLHSPRNPSRKPSQKE
jgi:hypothetical protein